MLGKIFFIFNPRSDDVFLEPQVPPGAIHIQPLQGWRISTDILESRKVQFIPVLSIYSVSRLNEVQN